MNANSPEYAEMVLEAAPSQRSPVWRLDHTGTPYRDEAGMGEGDWQGRKTVPPRGTFTLKLAGIAEKRNEPNKFYDPSKPGQRQYVDKTWVEFEIVGGKGNLTGRWFSNKWTWSLNEKATMGKFVLAMLGTDPPKQYNVLQLLGKQFEAMVNPKSDTYAELLVETVMPAEADPPPDVSNDTQRDQIIELAKDIWGSKGKALANLTTLLETEYQVEELEDLSREQADQLMNWLYTEPDSVKSAAAKAAEPAAAPF